MERLQKVIAHAGIASRRKAEEMIRQGRVKLNGKIVLEMGELVDPDRDEIMVDGKAITQERLVTFLFNKPSGVVTTMDDPQGRPCVSQFFQQVPQRVYPIGRLDFETEGLLLVSNDGDLAYRVMHPRFELDKVYHALVKGIPSEGKLEHLRRGILLEDGMTAPAQAELLHVDKVKSEALLSLTIHEGRNRQVRRMCKAIGHPVLQLTRVKLGFLSLEGVEKGAYRQLTPAEISQLKNLLEARS
ncbi:pseudouridine synthase [Rubeoparvulum massiliense]|uniref:pseudouridine synthase n=1 Tax=Rubeoparvulum massiliense TaxID=1631346 RepID=UPI00065E762E|nr:pseudouridine synthase [Rubeoparvulum massiliense]